jgi:uncharacterized protein
MLMKPGFDAYLDIETTGLSPFNDDITVIGIYCWDGKESRFTQLYGSNITKENLMAALDGVRTIYTYNGRRFDLPFIEYFLGMDFASDIGCDHNDLMYRCWEKNLRGGFKSVEKQLGISRETDGVDGLQAIYLWRQYLDENDEDALELLLKYNRDDVVNLRTLHEKLYE